MTDKDLFSKSQYTVKNQKFGYGNGSYFKEIFESPATAQEDEDQMKSPKQIRITDEPISYNFDHFAKS